MNISELETIISPLYLVGGSVRDTLLGLTPTDYDFATPLSPNQIELRLKQSGIKPYTAGKRFGTIGIKLNSTIAEITTFRHETYVANSRKPRVVFVDDLILDLKRRDFTINAMAKDGDTFIDPFNGKQDLNNHIIRSVGNPKERFTEDPLRMLRAARFASQLNFTIEEKTLIAIQILAPLILHVSKERWIQEFDKILLARTPSIGLDILVQTRLINFIIPELTLQVNYDQNSPYHTYTLWEHTKRVVDAMPSDINLRWAALLHDIGKPFVRTDKQDRSNYMDHDVLGGEIVAKLGTYLRWPNERTRQIADLVANHLSEDSPLSPYDNAAK